jgi:hypothetical protein
MLRSGTLSDASSEAEGRFLHATYSESGFGQTYFSRVRYLPGRYAVQFMEITNISTRQTNVRIKRIDSKGRARPTIPLLLPPLQTRRIRLGRLLSRYEEGVAEIQSDVRSSLLMNSVMKYYRNYNNLITMESSPIHESYGDLVYGSYNPPRRARSLLKISNLAATTTSGTISCYAKSEIRESIRITLMPGELQELELGDCFGQASSGVVELNSTAPGALVADILELSANDNLSVKERMR